jgi:hypothetical protein
MSELALSRCFVANGRTAQARPLAVPLQSKILPRVWVATVAMSFARLTDKATSGILAARDWFQVHGIYAAAISTEMIQRHAFRNRADQQFVGDSVRTQHSADLEWAALKESTIAEAQSRFPGPTSCGAGSPVDLVPEPDFEWQYAISSNLALHRNNHTIRMGK